jgi:LuxR family transcriptional regulator of csgAB operon
MGTPLQQVYILGGQPLQNSLLCEFLTQQNTPSMAIKSDEEISTETLAAKDQNLFLVDFNHEQLNDVIARLLEQDQKIASDLAMAVFIVDTESSLGRLAGLPMINGGFLYACPHAQWRKGVHAIFDGELWFPRKVLQQYLIKSRAFNKTFSRSEVALTDRELEVLKVMATGAKNSEIANNLNLSPHTIKTHIYNIFKKINASNRLQAVNWAQENL